MSVKPSLCLSLFVSVFTLSQFSLAEGVSFLVKCSVFRMGKMQTITLKMTRSKIIPMTETRWAKVSDKKNSPLSAFAENREEYGFEWEKTFKGRNGYSILELGTTADSFTIGVSPDYTKGFYSYRDLGSGNGHDNYSLTCTR